MMNLYSNLFTSVNKFPSTQYLGSKQKLITWIMEKLPEGKTVFDAFSGSGIVSYNLKKIGRRVISNDVLYCSYLFVKSTVENGSTTLSHDEINALFLKNDNKSEYIE